MTDRLRDRVALVTGAGRGIGRAVGLAFAAEGARLVLAARTRRQLDDAAQACTELGAEARAVVCDVSDWSSVEAMVDDVLGSEGRIDVLCHSAGIYGPIGPTHEIDPEAWEEAVRVNLVGAFNVCRAVLPGMIEQGAGKVLLLAGGGATAPLPNFSAYAASKAATVRLAETLAEEVKSANVQVNAIAPGLVDTTLQDDVLTAGGKAGVLLEKIQAARETGAGAVPPELAAELAVFLAGDDSGALTGKLVAAPYDPWREWTGSAIEHLNASQLYTLRRLDPFTLESVSKST